MAGAPLAMSAHVGAAPTPTAPKRPAARRTIIVSCAQATRCVLVLVNTRAHAAPNMGVSARPQKISPGRQYAVVLLYYFPRTRPEVYN